ncbi:MAG: 5-deoxy-glucuronate isomerase [Oscillospiraceae bacterium]|nr:5-deoxy-glucuronate isomerase [Oscillospiraceae bacterium]
MFFYPEFINGKKTLSEVGGVNSDMLMNIAVYRLKRGGSKTFLHYMEETAVLLVRGAVTFAWDENTEKAVRPGFFSHGPTCLHVAKGVSVTLTADEDSEIIVQSTENDRAFPSKLYRPEDCTSFVSCEGKWENTAVRDVVTVFDYNSAPYSNMVIGEVYARQGRWWSYIPHSHPQPEVYYYRFERPEGFGACFIGDEAHTVKDGSCGCFPGGYNHPQVTAPGYPMYNVWMIRHLDGVPWTERVDDLRYTWLNEDER